MPWASQTNGQYAPIKVSELESVRSEKSQTATNGKTRRQTDHLNPPTMSRERHVGGARVGSWFPDALFKRGQSEDTPLTRAGSALLSSTAQPTLTGPTIIGSAAEPQLPWPRRGTTTHATMGFPTGHCRPAQTL